MRIAADTNVLLRMTVSDDAMQARAAFDMLERAETIAVGVHALCEFTWVLRRRYDVSPTDIGELIGRLVATRNVVVDRPAVESGLQMLAAGGDFADGVIAYEGRRRGADTFVSFDVNAVALLVRQGLKAVTPA